MRIAQIAPIVERVPPTKYGGTERVIYALTEELVKQGHDVTLFASGDSKTSARLVAVYPRALREDSDRIEDIYGHNVWSVLNIGLAYRMQDEFDVIHDHTSQNSPICLPLADVSRTPVVMTLHSPFTPSNTVLFEFYNKPNIVTISKAQAKPAPNVHYIRNVYHGLPMEHFPFSNTHDGYLLFVGRISKEKGVHHAITVAEHLDMPLIIAATIDPRGMGYFKRYIQPRLTDQIRWVGEVDEAERNRLMSKALCVLHPVTWPEPFGLSLIESMACGAPVIAFNNGSIPEVIADGETGYVVQNMKQMMMAVYSVDHISRAHCREYALKHFSAKRMAKDYIEIYKTIISRHKRTQSSAPIAPTYLTRPVQTAMGLKLALR